MFQGHCAFYKVIGSAYRMGIELDRAIIAMSSRATSGIVKGVANLCIPVAISHRAPTLNAVELRGRPT